MATAINYTGKITELTPLTGQTNNNGNSSRVFVCNDIFKSCTKSTAEGSDIETGRVRALCTDEQLKSVAGYVVISFKCLIWAFLGTFGVLLVIAFVNAHSPKDAPNNDFSGSSSQSLSLS